MLMNNQIPQIFTERSEYMKLSVTQSLHMEFHQVLVKFKCESPLMGWGTGIFPPWFFFIDKAQASERNEAKLLCVNQGQGLVCLFHHWVLMAQHHAWYDKCWQYLSNTYA